MKIKYTEFELRNELKALEKRLHKSSNVHFENRRKNIKKELEVFDQEKSIKRQNWIDSMVLIYDGKIDRVEILEGNSWIGGEDWGDEYYNDSVYIELDYFVGKEIRPRR